MRRNRWMLVRGLSNRSSRRNLILPVLFLVGSLISCNGSETPPPGTYVPPSGDCPPPDRQNYCAHTCTGLIPIPDLGEDLFMGEQGGLYPGGQNVRPESHNQAGLDIVNSMSPLDVAGQPDSTGEIVFLSVGMSNADQEFSEFMIEVDAMADKNPSLHLVNGAQGGWEIDRIIDSTAEFWTIIDDRLAAEGLSPSQVQIIWFKEAEFQPQTVASDTNFPGYADTLEKKFTTALQICKQKFPNTKLCYIASRIYGGYDNTGGNPEPFAYYTGWAVKKLIEAQINGDAELAYSGTGAKVPWLSWGDYLWADGLRPRSDGLIWICPDDFKEDGRHPSVDIGRKKVAGLLLNFFRNDATTVPWFLAGQ